MNILLFIIMLTFSFSVISQSLDTLLMTQSDRIKLDGMRKNGVFNKSIGKNVPNIVRLSGVVLNEKNDAIVFINDTNTIKTRFINNSLHVHTKDINPKTLKIKVTKGKKTRYMKPGQVWSTSTKINEDYKLKMID